MLSNGNLHYLWDLERGSPYVITSFPTPDSVTGYQKITPNPQRLIEEQVGEDYIVRTQRPNYASEAAWQNEAERPGYIQTNKLRFLRPYQLKAIHSLFAVSRNHAAKLAQILNQMAKTAELQPRRIASSI